MAAASPHDAASPVRARFSDRLLAEAVRSYEDLGGEVADDAEAIRLAVQTGGDLEERLLARARHIAAAGPLRESLGHVRRLLGLATLAGLSLAAFAGVAAGRAALGLRSGEPVNFFWALGGLLGVQTLLLVLWLLTLLALPRGLASGSLGAVLVAGGRWLASRFQRSRHHQAALAAIAGVQARRGLATWSFSTLSHALWLAFNVGCLLTLVALLSTRQYAFSWETTILSESAYQRFTQTLAVAPNRLGFDTPSPEQIAASRRETASEADRPTQKQWGHLLLGSVLVYGLLPRLLLAGGCALAYAASRRRYRLDLEQPGYLRLRSALLAEETYLGVVPDEDGETAAGPEPTSTGPRERPAGPPAVVALEIEPPAAGWRPQEMFGATVLDLGNVEDGASRRRVLETLRTQATEPSPLIVVCDLTVTPDRGLASFLASLRETRTRPLQIVLTAGERLRQRVEPAAVGQRSDDWRACLQHAGIDETNLHEVDLDHLTAESRRMLAALLDVGDADDNRVPASGEPLDVAFALIVEHAATWEGEPQPPDWQAQAKLQEAIARLFDHHDAGWRQRWLPAKLERPSLNELGSLVQERGSAMLALLPDRLKQSPKWLAAGAGAGALACITAGVLASPLAFAALPSWSLIGAAIAGVTHLARTGKEMAGETETTEHDFAQAVRSAILFTLVLRMQGQGEARIARALDRALPEAEPELTSAADVREYLAVVRQRYATFAASGDEHG
jgi:Protein of unknown function (DUF2868)